MINAKSSILDEIKETIEKIFSIRVTEYAEINKGLLNLKWKLITSNGILFIKQLIVLIAKVHPKDLQTKWCGYQSTG
jgi:hypothetical protein